MASSRRLLLSTMKQICLCAAASFAVRPGSPPGSPPAASCGLSRVPPAPPAPPIPVRTPGLLRVLPILLCPCLTRGWGERAPPSQFAQEPWETGLFPVPGPTGLEGLGGAAGGHKRVRDRCQRLPKGDIHFLPPRPQPAPLCRHRLRGEARTRSPCPGPVPLRVAPSGEGCAGSTGGASPHPAAVLFWGGRRCAPLSREAGASPGIRSCCQLCSPWFDPFLHREQSGAGNGTRGENGHGWGSHGCWLGLVLGFGGGRGKPQGSQAHSQIPAWHSSAGLCL